MAEGLTYSLTDCLNGLPTDRLDIWLTDLLTNWVAGKENQNHLSCSFGEMGERLSLQDTVSCGSTSFVWHFYGNFLKGVFTLRCQDSYFYGCLFFALSFSTGKMKRGRTMKDNEVKKLEKDDDANDDGEEIRMKMSQEIYRKGKQKNKNKKNRKRKERE